MAQNQKSTIVVKIEMAEQRERHLLAMNANPELAALSMPVPQVSANTGVDTGEVLRSEGFTV